MITAPKPCPFCGHEPVLTRSRQGSYHTYHCDNDDCMVRPQALAETLEQARAIWDERHEG
jgi:ssDNA-binding Zn-finger/Zn-ribbon topoisomerase 1